MSSDDDEHTLETLQQDPTLPKNSNQLKKTKDKYDGQQIERMCQKCDKPLEFIVLDEDSSNTSHYEDHDLSMDS